MLEARAHAGPGNPEAEAAASALQLALSDALQGDMGTAERCHALSALIWAQVTPAARQQHDVSAGKSTSRSSSGMAGHLRRTVSFHTMPLHSRRTSRRAS